MKIQTAIGYKFFKDLGEEVEIVRLVKARKYKKGGVPAEVTIEDINGKRSKIRTEVLEKEWTPLEPDGIATISLVTMKDSSGDPVSDVIVSVIKYLNVMVGDKIPFAVCRQNIVDFFNNLVVRTEDESDLLYGISVNQNDCPTNFDFRLLSACNSVEDFDMVNFYREDTVDDILKLVDTTKYDIALQKSYDAFCDNEIKYNGGDVSLMFKKKYKGWCTSVELLLKENNFQYDINEMLGIADIDFDISKYFVKKVLPTNEEVEYTSVTDDLKVWLSHVYKVNMRDVTVLEYNHDINLAEFNNARYFFIRNTDKQLYMVVYTIAGEYKEADMEAEMNKPDFSTEFRLAYYDKYSNPVA